MLSDSELIQKAKEWFQAQTPVSYSPGWDKATLTRFGNDNFIILPSNINISDASTQIKSFVVINISDRETEGNIVELFNLKGEIAYTENEIISTYLTKGDQKSYPSNLSVSLLIFDLEHKFLKGNSIDSGEISKKLNLLNLKDLKSQMLMRGGNDVGFGKQCVEWYLVTTDNFGMVVSEIYLFTMCSGAGGGGGANSGSGGSGGTSSTSVNVPDVEPSESDYRYTCPDNFEFSSVTNNSLWQEGELTNIYCNLGIYDYMSGTISNSKTVTIPAVSFGLPYNDVNGGLIYTKNQAKAISADALNMAEEDMRKKYKSNPYLTSGQLADYWVSRMNIRMKELTSSKGKVGRTGSINPSQTPPTKAYNPC